MITSVVFIACAYALGFVFMVTPNFYLEYKLKNQGSLDFKSESFCLANSSFKDEVASFTLKVITGASVLYFALFKLF